jgi:fumarylacetoacetate (FAA) hydrolase family protein
MTSTLSESTQTAKLAKEIIGLKRTIAESNNAIEAKNQELKEAQRKARIAEDTSNRKQIMSEMLGPLNKGQKELMGTLLESVKTSQLKAAYKKYLPSVLSEDTEVKTQANKAKLTEGRADKREVSGNKVNKSTQQDVGGSADIIELKKLAGLS